MAKWAALVGEVLDYQLFEAFGGKVTVGTLLAVIVILLVTLIAARLVHRGFERALKREGLKDPGTIRAIQRLSHYVILLVGIGVALESIGFDLTALFTAGAVFAVGVGFAMQNVAQNFVSGVILLVERTIKPGDILEAGGQIVKVSRMGIRATVARTLDEEEVIIPNSQLVQNTVKNFTLSDSLYRLRASVGVVYSSDMALVAKVLGEVAEGMTWRVASMEPRVLLQEFADSSVNFEVSVWVRDPWRSRRLRSQLHDAIWWALKEAGVVIAFPQLDLHLDPPVADALRMMAGGGGTPEEASA